MTARGSRSLTFALYANAALLAAILIVLVGRGHDTSYGQTVPLAGGDGLYVMPCQLHPDVWGCYVLDSNRKTLCVYEYRGGEKTLTLTAARDVQYDSQLKDFDTAPAWYDVKKMAEDAQQAQRIDGSGTPATQP